MYLCHIDQHYLFILHTTSEQMVLGMEHTFYFPVMRTESQTIVVDLVQQYNVDGSNSVTEYNMFYEHMIYCPYSSGVWISEV